MEYTGGEWRVNRTEGKNKEEFAEYIVTSFPNGGVKGIALIRTYPYRLESEANARLIASAPDLYEACQAIVKWLDDIPGHVGRQIKFSEAGETAPQVYKQLIQAIAKAEGK